MGFACSGASTAGVAVLRGCAGRAPSALPARFGSSREGGAYILRQPFSIASATPCRYSGVVPGDACVSPVFVVSQLHFCASDPTSPQCLDPCSHPCRHSSVVFGRSRLRAWRVHSRASGRLLRRLRAPPLNCTRIPAPCLVTHAYEDSGFTPLFWVAFSSPGLRPCHPRRTERLRRAATIASACASGAPHLPADGVTAYRFYLCSDVIDGVSVRSVGPVIRVRRFRRGGQTVPSSRLPTGAALAAD